MKTKKGTDDCNKKTDDSTSGTEEEFFEVRKLPDGNVVRVPIKEKEKGK